MGEYAAVALMKNSHKQSLDVYISVQLNIYFITTLNWVIVF